MLFDSIPIQFYTPLYYHVLLLVVLITFFNSQTTAMNSAKNLTYIKCMGFFLLGFVLLYMGLRPIHGVFVDMTTYAAMFERYTEGDVRLISGDYLFSFFMYVTSLTISVQTFFLICTFLYIIPLYLVCKKWFGKYWFYAFLMLIASFSFWAYGTNGIRNGLASSFFLLAMSKEKRIYQILWLVLSVGTHKSMLLPSLGFVITRVYNTPKSFFILWLISIPLSLALPGFWEKLFASMVEDNRASYLTTASDNDKFTRIGFRWDFLLYSTTGVISGWYFLIRRKYHDLKYSQLYNIFLFTNSFWILVIRANYSNRFAYLSWFMLALIIIYPWLKNEEVRKKHKKIGFLILLYFAFTYLMNIIL